MISHLKWQINFEISRQNFTHDIFITIIIFNITIIIIIIITVIITITITNLIVFGTYFNFKYF